LTRFGGITQAVSSPSGGASARGWPPG